MKRRFEIWINEGAFFHEPWISDCFRNKEYRYDRVPPRIKKAFAQELKDQGKMNPEEAAMIIDWVIGS